jgi:hypothetical protein
MANTHRRPFPQKAKKNHKSDSMHSKQNQWMRLILLSGIILFGMQASAQPCTPDPHNHTVGITPTNFPNGKATVSYSQVFQLKFPSDTTIMGIPATIDSVRLDSIEGWPSGFSYVCNEPDCAYDGGANGCVKVTGTPASAGTYQVVVHYIAYGKLDTMSINAPYSDTCLYVVEDISGMRGHSAGTGFSVSGNNPNPFRYSTDVVFNLPAEGHCTLSVYDLCGKQISSSDIVGKAGQNSARITREGLNEGVYFYTLRYRNAVVTRKMIITD